MGLPAWVGSPVCSEAMRVRTATWSPRWAAGALVAAVLLAGCSDPDQPGTVPRSSPTVTTSSPSPTPTSVEAQVEAAVRNYYAELEQAIRTNDTTRLKQLALETCPCYGSVRSIDKAAKEQQQTPDVRITVVKVAVHDVEGKTAAADVAYDVNGYNVLSKDGEVISRVPARKDRLDLSFVRPGEQWLLANVFNLGGR